MSLSEPLLPRNRSTPAFRRYSTEGLIHSGYSLSYLPPEVLRVVGSYLDAGSLLRLQCSSRSMTESLGEGGAWQKAFVRDFGFGLESLGPFGRMLSMMSVGGQKQYVRRMQALENVKQDRVRQAQDTAREDKRFSREACLNKALHVLWYHPTAVVQLWCPFVFVLLVCLKADGYLRTSWWIPMLPLIVFGYMTAVGGMMSWGFRKLSELSSVVCCNHYTDWSKNVYEEPNRCGMQDPRGSFGVVWFYLAWGCLGTTGVLFGLKLEGSVDMSYVSAMIPVWLWMGMLSTAGLWSCGGNALPASAVFFFMFGLWLVPMSVCLALRADGAPYRLSYCFIPMWMYLLCCWFALFFVTVAEFRSNGGRLGCEHIAVGAFLSVPLIGITFTSVTLVLRDVGLTSMNLSTCFSVWMFAMVVWTVVAGIILIKETLGYYNEMGYVERNHSQSRRGAGNAASNMFMHGDVLV